MGFLEGLGKVFTDPKNLETIGSLTQGIGSVVGAIEKNKMNKKMYNLQKDQYNHLMQDYNRQKKRQENAEKQMYLGFSNGLIDLDKKEK